VSSSLKRSAGRSTDHRRPFQRSISARAGPEIAPSRPTATQSRTLTHDTLSSTPSAAAAPGWITQRWPSQRSASAPPDASIPPTPAPTPMQSVADGQETDSSWPPGTDTEGTVWLLHTVAPAGPR
jgi:hypothetical protein